MPVAGLVEHLRTDQILRKTTSHSFNVLSSQECHSFSPFCFVRIYLLSVQQLLRQPLRSQSASAICVVRLLLCRDPERPSPSIRESQHSPEHRLQPVPRGGLLSEQIPWPRTQLQPPASSPLQQKGAAEVALPFPLPQRLRGPHPEQIRHSKAPSVVQPGSVLPEASRAETPQPPCCNRAQAPVLLRLRSHHHPPRRPASP